ncbi:hypothetical protein OESDEN_20423 [Oesophagostomum dentatum]|uniref:ZP domain-containing protein n=1 Tax=Oesophagostomum dentatum TaxID=61180 RepID=A0A0B1S9K3_OESDE|nr:hypothetical protein OESDEN_20423 [Oesophagostomum dentatum]
MTCNYQVTPQTDQCSINGIGVGAPLLHQWSCDPAHGNFFVHSCVAEDPVTHREEVIVDSKGCPIDKSIVSELTYSGNGTVTAHGKAVRFADAPTVRFSCRVRLCNKGNKLCSASFPPQCRSKREVMMSDEVKHPSDLEPFTREYEDSSAYDDNIDDVAVGVMPSPEPATMKMMEEKSHKDAKLSTQPVRSAFSIKPLETFSSTAPLFPSGGVDMTLNSKSVAIALQLRANSSQTSTIREITAKSENVENKAQRKGVSQIVSASIKREPPNVAQRQVTGFAREPEDVQSSVASDTQPPPKTTTETAGLVATTTKNIIKTTR